jgi:Lrp/AsnC family leucine-responsive transcriptional regulator
MIDQNNAQKSNIEDKILNELQKNCRQNLDEIGKKCGCSRYKVGRFIKKLEDNNMILGYSAILNPIKTKEKHFILLIKRTSHPIDEEVLNKLPLSSGMDILPDLKNKLLDTYYVHGIYDWVITFLADDLSDAKDFCNKILKFYNKYVERLDLLETVGPLRKNGFRIPEDEKITRIL